MRMSLLMFAAMLLLGFKYNDSFRILGLRFGAPTVYGKGNVSSPEVGDIIYDSSVSKFYGYDQSGNWVDFSSGGIALPPGTILPYGGTVVPNGFLYADGSEVSRTVYSDLFDAIGVSFGAGNGSSTFNLPDFRGRFLRGVDGTAGNDPNKTTRSAMAPGGNVGNLVGSVQGDSFTSHNHVSGFASGTVSTRYGYVDTGLSGYAFDQQGSTSNTHGALSSSSGGSETRPKNAYVNYIIKY